MKESPIRKIQGAPSWSFSCDRVEANLTRDGGHLAPLRFATARGVVEPMAVAPWGEERLSADTDPVLRHLRGDFFCAPFGGNAEPWRGRKVPAHGETATGRWAFTGLEPIEGGIEFSARMRTTLIPGMVTKRISLRRGETNVYCRHILEGFSADLCVGHHAMLSFSADRGPGHISLSPWREGRVCPTPLEAPEAGGYSALRTGAAFRSLARVPLAAGGLADLSTYPAREGYEDLVMVTSRGRGPLAWTAVCFPQARYLWFALKDPAVLASTVLWHSNGGRHFPPWNGRHRRVLGLEEVTSYFHYGQAQSAAPNPMSARGIPTVLHLPPGRPTTVNYIMGVVPLAAGFDRVRGIRPVTGGILITASSGSEVRHTVDTGFLGIPAPGDRQGPPPACSPPA